MLLFWNSVYFRTASRSSSAAEHVVARDSEALRSWLRDLLRGFQPRWPLRCVGLQGTEMFLKCFLSIYSQEHYIVECLYITIFSKKIFTWKIFFFTIFFITPNEVYFSLSLHVFRPLRLSMQWSECGRWGLGGSSHPSPITPSPSHISPSHTPPASCWQPPATAAGRCGNEPTPKIVRYMCLSLSFSSTVSLEYGPYECIAV